MEICDKLKIESIVEKAKEKYPISFQYTGRLYEKELTDIEDICDVRCSSVYMNGTATYCIKYRLHKI